MKFAKEFKTEGPSEKKKIRLSNTLAPKVRVQQENLGKLEQRIRSPDWIDTCSDESRKKTCSACHPFKKKEYFTSSSERHLESDQHKQHAQLALTRDAESKLSLFLAKNNLPHHVAEELGPLLKKCFPDSPICQELTFNSEKVESTMITAIGPDIQSELANTLRTRKFSILADEVTDIPSVKTFSITVRYFDDDTGGIEISFWKLSSMKNTNVVNREAVAEHLYKGIRESFNEFDIPDKNIVGFGSDGCNVIMSGEDSVASRFKRDYPGIVIVQCINHSIHLCASKAAESLPARCEELARAVHLSLTCSKSPHLLELQPLIDLEPHRRLHPSQARWISVTAVVDCMLTHWQALIRYYDDMSKVEKLVSGDEVLKWLRDPYIKLYYHFLHSVLHKFDEFNALFESSHEVITEMKAKTEDLYKYILESFLERNYVRLTRLQDVDPLAKDKQLSDPQMDLGTDALMKIAEITNNSKDPYHEDLKTFCNRCRQFLQQVAVEMGKRCVFGNSVMEHIEILRPKVIRSEQVKTFSILKLAETLPRSTSSISSSSPTWRECLDNEWSELRRQSKNLTEVMLNENKPDVFWGKILNEKNDAGENKFSVLARFALDCLVIPHTNADYARIFKEINLRRMSNKPVSDCEATYRVAISWRDIKCDGTGCMVFQRSTRIPNGEVGSSKLQVDSRPIASTSRTQP